VSWLQAPFSWFRFNARFAVTTANFSQRHGNLSQRMENDPELREEQESRGWTWLCSVWPRGSATASRQKKPCQWMAARLCLGSLRIFASQPCRDLRGIPGREGITTRSDGVQPWLAWRHGQPGKRNSAALKTLREWLLKLDVQERQRLSFFNAR
jgi:hypothetical protein